MSCRSWAEHRDPY